MEFLFAVHNHQPVGNFPSIFKSAFEACYRPLLTELAAHPSFRFALHFSGPLWEHMAASERDCWELVRRMSAIGQVELLGGGFYEPVLSLIPEEDRGGQIRMMSDFLGDNFGQRPRGLWLAERVWEPDLPRTLAAAGIEYTLLDEEHFHYAGVRDLAASYVTESEGRRLRVFPIDKTLRYYIPFRSLGEIDAYFASIREAGGTAILGDDGEKFGLWPGTHKWVYDEGWLRKFLAFIEEKDIRTLTFSEYLDSHPPAGRVYLPPASYEEMTEWALEPADQEAYRAAKAAAGPEGRRFLRAGFFRDFCLKYPEADQLHKRMILVSRALSSAGVEGQPLRDLYKGQCNDPYWHGVFGGLYLPHLREAAYRHLLQAERAVPDPEGWQALDYDCDGREELLYRDRTFGLLAKPDRGGAIVEIDHRPRSRNVTNVLGRRPEAYHMAAGGAGEGTGKSIHEIGKTLPPEASGLLRYDRSPRHSLIDHFFRSGTTEEDLSRADFGEQGDFAGGVFSFAVSGRELRLERRGSVRVGEERLPFAVRKTLASADGVLRVDIEIENLSSRAVGLTYGSEWNFLAFPHELELLGPAGAVLHGGALRFEPSPPPSLWSFALKTLSQSEEGFDIIHQGFCLCPVWPLEWSGRGAIRLSIVLKETYG